MLTGKALIPVKVLRSFENWKEGDMILIEDWKARELWELGIVEIIDEADKVIGEIDKVLEEERKNAPISAIPENLYERAEFYIYYLEKYIQKGGEGNIDVIHTKLTKLKNLKKKYKMLKDIRFKKILEAVRLRPNSMEILSRLAPQERRIYLQISRIRNEWIGE
ncbi:Gins 23 protein [Pyrococcus horikoshii]|nr:Gins 23 protein [Pyrococcus horikoshii]HII60178.1 DNA replication complex GINS family protein [Pyrococcus horikoshii]